MILFIKNIDIEGPETMGVFFKQKGFEILEIDLSRGGNFHDVDLDQLDAVVVLGGPMNVYETKKYPYLTEEEDFIKNVLAKDIPFLGICLGSQLLAKVCDAKIVKAPEEEIGFFHVSFTQEGLDDPLFKNILSPMLVYQWHADMFELPENAVHLALGEKCPNQAFRIGKNAYAIQFHIEITDRSIKEWSFKYFHYENTYQMKLKDVMLNDYTQRRSIFKTTSFQFHNNFLSIVRAYNQEKNK